MTTEQRADSRSRGIVFLLDVDNTLLDNDRLKADLARRLEGVEIACVFGGDGTMLRAARALAPLGVPLLGVNLGRLGFLTVTSIEDFDPVMADVAAGGWSVEERALLHARLTRSGAPDVHVHALNDVVVARGKLVRA